MPTENLRSLIGTPTTKVGTFLFEFATPGIGQILKAAGADFAVLDMEHTGFGFETVRQVVRYCQAAMLPLVVRVPSQQRHHISRALDTGADGVMVPIVSSVEQATIAAAKKHGKSVGRLSVDARQGAAFAAMGYDFVSIAGDVWLLQQAFAAGIATVRKG